MPLKADAEKAKEKERQDVISEDDHEDDVDLQNGGAVKDESLKEVPAAVVKEKSPSPQPVKRRSRSRFPLFCIIDVGVGYAASHCGSSSSDS